MLEGGAIMEDSAAQKRKQQEFALASVSEVSSAPSSASPGVSLFAGDRLQILNESRHVALNAYLSAIQVRFFFFYFFILNLALIFFVCSLSDKYSVNGVLISLFLTAVY